MHKASFQEKSECIRLGTHRWTSTAGGYWCPRCKLTITDAAIGDLRRNGHNDSLEEMLKQLAESAEQWINDLHIWTHRSSNEL